MEEVLRLMLPLIVTVIFLIVTEGSFSALEWLAEIASKVLDYFF